MKFSAKRIISAILILVMMLSFVSCKDEEGFYIEGAPSITIQVGETVLLSVVKPDNAKGKVVWTSSDDAVVLVEDGAVVGVASGVSAVYATLGDYSDKVIVTVTTSKNNSGTTGGGTTGGGTTGGGTTGGGTTGGGTTGGGTTGGGTTGGGTTGGGTTGGTTEGLTELAFFDFGEKGSSGHVDNGTPSSEPVNFTDGSYTIEFTNLTSFYTECYDQLGNSCLKIGTASKTGSFTFTVPSDVDSVVIMITGYKAKTSTYILNGGEAVALATSSNDGAYTKVVIDTTNNKTITLETDGVANGQAYRFMIDSISYWG